MDEDQVNDQPVDEAPVEEQQVQDQPEQEAPETQEETQDPAAPADPVVDEDDEEIEPYQSESFEYLKPELERDAQTGDVSVDQLLNYLDQREEAITKRAEQRAAEVFAARAAEQRAWKKVEAEYPEIAQDKQLRDMIHQLRNGDIVAGRDGNLMRIAKQFMGPIREARSAGKVQAQETVQYQKNAQVETQGQPGNPDVERRQLLEQRMRSRNRLEAEAARQEWLKERIESGDI